MALSINKHGHLCADGVAFATPTSYRNPTIEARFAAIVAADARVAELEAALDHIAVKSEQWTFGKSNSKFAVIVSLARAALAKG